MNHSEEYLVPANERHEVDLPPEYSGSLADTDNTWSEIDAMIADGAPELVYQGEDEQIMLDAQRAMVPLQCVAYKRGKPMQDPKWWTVPNDLGGDQDDTKIDLIKNYQNPLVDMARAVSGAIQFPLNTAFLHGCGTFSAALIRKFKFMRYGEKQHIGLYTIAAQPPSSGKTAVNKKFLGPIKSLIEENNKKSAPQLLVAQMQLNKFESELNKNIEGAAAQEAAQKVIDARERVDYLSPYILGATNATPEGLEMCAAKQRGIFSIITDEAEGATVVFGDAYSKGGSSPSLDIILHGWDGGMQLTLRAGRPGYMGELYGAVAVLAQEGTIPMILSAGRTAAGTSRGAAERFWLLMEPNIMHLRNEKNAKPIDGWVTEQYQKLCANVVNEQFDQVLEFSAESVAYLMDISEGFQPQMADGKRYGDDFMRSVVGKHQIQICKMASVLHVAKEWAPTGNRSTTIQKPEVMQASYMYTQMLKIFMGAVEANGLGGDMPAVIDGAKKLAEFVKDRYEPTSEITLQKFRDSVRGRSVFKKHKKLQNYIETSVLPELEKNGYIVYDRDKKVIFINPRVRKLS